MEESTTSLYLKNFREGDHVFIDDNGKALEGLAKLVKDSGAELVGAGVVIEKGLRRFLKKTET